MKTINRVLTAGALALAIAAPTQAVMISQTGSVPVQLTDFDNEALSPAIAQFDTALGMLNTITLNFTGTLEGLVNWESLDAAPATLMLDLSAEVILNIVGLEFATVLPTFATTTTVSAFDGDIDFAGTSGGTSGDIAEMDMFTIVLSSGDAGFDAFVGLGNVDATCDGVGDTNATGSGNLITQFQTRAGCSLNVVYDYDAAGNPIPEPTTLALIAMGLLGFGGRKIRFS